jgi:hypothetical protein
MRSVALIVLAAVGVWSPATASAQAWVGEQNSATVGLSYVYGTSDRLVVHELDDSDAFIKHHAIDLEVEYVTPVEGLALTASLLSIATRWDETSDPHPPALGEWDDGEYHFTVTDFTPAVRYQFLSEPLAASVSLGGVIPTHDYVVFGANARGRGLKALSAGLAVGRTLDPVVPELYIHLEYQYFLVESVQTDDPMTEEYNLDRSEYSAQIGYGFLDKFDVNLALDGRKMHGGFDFTEFADVSDTVRENHDQLLREDIVLLGGGLSYDVTDKFSIGGAVRFFLSGRNTRDVTMFGLSAQYLIL